MAAVGSTSANGFCFELVEQTHLDSMQAWFQKRHQSSNKFVQNYPLAKLIFKPWYPTYLRFMGVWAWMFAFFFAYTVFRILARR
jgi:hypothetical protein